MDIVFSNATHWEGRRDCLCFPANVNDKIVNCAITVEALLSRFGYPGANGPNEADAVRVYTENKHAIQNEARALIQRGAGNKGQEVLIRG